MIKLNAIGKDMQHSGDFCIWRPDGSGDNLLVIFKTSAMLIIDGVGTTVPPDSLIIYKKGTPQYYKTICGNYANHFIHFDVTDDDDILSHTQTDRLITSVNISAVEELLTILCRENMSASEHREQYADMLIRMILMKISEGGDVSIGGEHPYSQQLRQLRADIYSNAAGFCSVRQLAERMNLSPSYFQAVYRKQFGVSCYDDIISARVRTGQYYLATTALPVREISQLCGYDTDICFMRAFKKRTGLTPCEYRKRAASSEDKQLT